MYQYWVLRKTGALNHRVPQKQNRNELRQLHDPLENFGTLQPQLLVQGHLAIFLQLLVAAVADTEVSCY